MHHLLQACECSIPVGRFGVINQRANKFFISLLMNRILFELLKTKPEFGGWVCSKFRVLVTKLVNISLDDLMDKILEALGVQFLVHDQM